MIKKNPTPWNGDLLKGNRILLHDQRSTGYDIRDLQVVLQIIKNLGEAKLDIIVDRRLEKILLQYISNPNISLFYHDIVRLPIPLLEVYEAAVLHKSDYYARFDQLSNIYISCKDRAIPRTSYLDIKQSDVEKSSLYLDSIEKQIKIENSIVESCVFVLFVWQKPEGSEFGGQHIQSRIIEGNKMSMNLENISNSFAIAQNKLLSYKIALVPICVQYGDRKSISDDIKNINSGFHNLLFPIYFPPIELVDWNGSFYEQVAFLKAVAIKGGILSSIGTTAQHLGLAVGGLFQIVAVNVEYSDLDGTIVDGKGVSYWKSTEKFMALEAFRKGEQSTLKVLNQIKPEDWKPVLEDMIYELVTASKSICSSRSI